MSKKVMTTEILAKARCVPFERSSKGEDSGLASLLLLADVVPYIGVSSLYLSHSVGGRTTSQTWSQENTVEQWQESELRG